MTDDAIARAAELLQHATSVSVLSGAGVSKESGVPTFRDALEGLWEQYDPEELATPTAFQRNPKLVWDWYEHRRKMAADVQPNPGHYAIAELEKHFEEFVVITQNVDALHEQAGSSDIIHLHGSLFEHKCFYDCRGNPTTIDLSTLTYDEDDGPPMCPYCGRKSVRPAVVWFGEMLPNAELQRAFRLSQSYDVMLIVGTSGLVTPAANLPRMARQSGKKLIEVNPNETAHSGLAAVCLRGPSGEMLPRLLDALQAL